ncbi:MAG: SagB family peptide dehydrogenase [Anaerolineae bacterium]|nr:SagB family peptide dehydrogenase [Anaerolineae bacterium]MDW8099531.1 SagB family peptide dehydrogenase [Anaerolineae bacterium]
MRTLKAISRHDVSYLVSAGLLVTATATAFTGLISDLWDLNEFVYHKYTGYAAAILALAHVYLHWGQLLGYARWRLGRRARMVRDRGEGQEGRRAPSLPRTSAPLQLLSRRGLIGLMLGGLGGFILGRSLRSQSALPYGGDVGAIYHEWSKPKVLSWLGTVANWGRQPALYKEYTWAERIPLPLPNDFRGLSTEEAIQRRRSVRDYSGQPMTLMELSRLLYYTSGINAERWGYKLRAAPSAGALYPIEIYPVVHRVEGLQPGLYHYAVRDHALELLRAADLRGEITRHGLMQEFLGQANLVLVFTAIFQRLRWKYQERTYRYALLEAGHLGQNVYLAATSVGMGACAVGAFLDDDLNAMLGIDGQHEAAIYMLAVGKV